MQRSGSTLLACLLNQHPEIYATATSPLLDVLWTTSYKLEECASQFTFNYELKSKILISSIIESFHEDNNKSIVIDKHRAWPAAISMITKEYRKPKIICTNRSVPEIITSFINLIGKNYNTIDKTIRSQGLPISINNRADFLFNQYVNYPRKTLITALEQYRECVHIVEYNDIISNPQETMNKIYEFLEIDSFNHNFNNIENTCNEEKDEAWGIENLHVIRNKLQKTSTPPEEVLGKELTEYYSQFDVKYS